MAVGSLAFWHKMKVWSVTIVGFNVLFSTLLAIGLFQMIANILDGVMSVMSYYNDLIAFVAVFAISFAFLMFVTSSISKIELRFTDKTDSISKWIAVLLVVLGYVSTTTYVFYETMPEKPKQSSVLFPMKIVDFMSKGSLSPMVNGSVWNTDEFVKSQYIRDSGVYKQTVDQGNVGWKFEGDSPNAN